MHCLFICYIEFLRLNLYQLKLLNKFWLCNLGVLKVTNKFAVLL